MAKIIYLSYDGLTDMLGMSQIIPYLKLLSKEGHEILIVSFEKDESYQLRNKLVRNDLSMEGIQWKPLSYTKKPPVLSTLYDLFRLERVLSKIVPHFSPEIIHCRSYLTSIVGLRLKQRLGVQFLFDMRGFWADERVEGRIWNLKNPIYKWMYSYFKRKERELVLGADSVVCLTESAKNIIMSWPESDDGSIPITVIPCCVDVNKFDPKLIGERKRELLKREIGIKTDEFVLSYLGSLGTWYLLDEMLAFFACLLVQIPSARFLFVTWENPDFILSKASEIGLPLRSILVKSAERTDVPLYLSLSDCAIFFIQPSYSKTASSPTKQAEVMSMDIPLVCNKGVGDTDLIIESSGAGWLIKELNVSNYELIVSQIIREKKAVNNGRSYTIANLSLKEGCRRYDRIYHQMMVT